ncbi:hypothetical protein [Actinacidiphila guanduensis]|uniref:Iron complex transport system substrate-binding protein n=1 Tax=Actinacidiphila guanduensis TaxID=310781 RepID=A0A1H0LJP7_9ACTN|nr:hypothetical protein [Actinacidiphila guanduensis]SDO68256.1 iron complex transport system substrate-binding protein [Actinacidiphila guanduensis]
MADDLRKWRFTDDRGREASGSGAPRVVAYVRAAAALAEYGLHPVAVYGSGHDDPAAPDPAKSGGLDLTAVPYLGRGADLEEARLRESGADLVVDVTYDGKAAYAVAEPAADAAGVPVAALGVGGEADLGAIVGRFAALAAALGAGTHPGRGELAAAEEELRSTVARGRAPRALALSPAGPDQVHIARPATWPELRRLTELGLPLADPGPGAGVNWRTVGWDALRDIAAGNALLLTDTRANATPRAELAALPTWRHLTATATALPWNPELPPAPGAVAAFLRTVAAAAA